MKLADTTGADPNRLPYLLTNGAGNRVPVEFAPLTMAERPEIEGADWLGSVFRETWRHFCGVPSTLKLVEVGASSPILGVLRIGVVIEGEKFLRKSLLETTPALRFRPGGLSPVRGVGRVLVARLVVESYNQGAGGAIYVEARPETFGFYRHLGFIPWRKSSNGYLLQRNVAEALLTEGTK